jgi:hypothetical protein
VRLVAAIPGMSATPGAYRGLGWRRMDGTCPGRSEHPERMAPELAAHLIHAYSGPGTWSSIRCAESAPRSSRPSTPDAHVIGVDCEPGWTLITRDNLALAAARGATGRAKVLCADSRDLGPATRWDLAGAAALVLTSPPLNSDRVNDDEVSDESQVNLANVTVQGLFDGLTQIFTTATNS